MQVLLATESDYFREYIFGVYPFDDDIINNR